MAIIRIGKGVNNDGHSSAFDANHNRKFKGLSWIDTLSQIWQQLKDSIILNLILQLPQNFTITVEKKIFRSKDFPKNFMKVSFWLNPKFPIFRICDFDFVIWKWEIMNKGLSFNLLKVINTVGLIQNQREKITEVKKRNHPIRLILKNRKIKISKHFFSA